MMDPVIGPGWIWKSLSILYSIWGLVGLGGYRFVGETHNLVFDGLKALAMIPIVTEAGVLGVKVEETLLVVALAFVVFFEEASSDLIRVHDLLNSLITIEGSPL